MIVILPFLLGLQEAEAQQQAESDTTQLPEIAPREIEIRGELQIDFPSVERQPLDGFWTSPTLPRVPTSRVPYREPYALELDSLPGRVSSTVQATQALSSSPPPRSGSFELGVGRYVSRFFEGHISTPLSDNETLAFELDYSGTEGETPFAALDTESASDEGEGGLRFRSRRDPIHVDATLMGRADDYNLFGAPRVAPLTSDAASERTLTSGGANVNVKTVGSIRSSVGVSFTHTESETTFPDTDFTLQQDRISVEGSIQLPLGPVDGSLDGSFSHTRLRDDVPDDAESELDVGGTVTLYEGPEARLEGGARVLWTKGPSVPVASSSPDISSTYVSPVVNAEWSPTSWATIVAHNTPHLEGGSLLSVHGDNPYIERAPSTRATLYMADARTGVDISAGWIRLEPRVGIRYAPSYRFFSRSVGPTADGLFSVQHGEARIIHGGGEVALQGVEGIQASVGVSIRDGELTNRDTDIPNFASVTADAMAAFSFADDKGYIQVTGTVLGPRDVSTGSQEEVDSFVAFDLRGSYAVTSIIDAVVRLNNIGSDTLERWPDFPRPANSVAVGIRMHW